MMETTQFDNLKRRALHDGKSPDAHDDSKSEDDENELDIDSHESKSRSSPITRSPVAKKGIYPCLDGLDEPIKTRPQHAQTPKEKDKIVIIASYVEPTHDKIIVAIIILIFAMLGIFWLNKDSAAAKYPMTENVVNDIIGKIKADFQHQPETTMKVINASLGSVVSVGYPARPAVLTLISNTDLIMTVECLAWILADLLKEINKKNYLMVNGMSYSNMESNVAKEKIDKQISKHFQEGEFNVAIVKNLHKIPAGAAMIFHGYCDDTNAKFKKSIYIMTVTTDEDVFYSMTYKEIDGLLRRQLEKSWSDALSSDQLAPLLARLTVSAATVLPDTLPSYCGSIPPA